jgi:two-component system response regulator VicR
MEQGTIVIIDNDLSILDLMSIILEEAGYIVVKLLEPPKIPFTKFKPDFLILDIGPFNKGNKSFHEKFRKNSLTSSIPVMLTSTCNGLKEVAENWMADCFLCKPFDIDDLTNKIKQLLK